MHSALMVPIFEKDNNDKPLAVFELVQSDKDVVFPAVMSWLRQHLEVRFLEQLADGGTVLSQGSTWVLQQLYGVAWARVQRCNMCVGHGQRPLLVLFFCRR